MHAHLQGQSGFNETCTRISKDRVASTKHASASPGTQWLQHVCEGGRLSCHGVRTWPSEATHETFELHAPHQWELEIKPSVMLHVLHVLICTPGLLPQHRPSQLGVSLLEGSVRATEYPVVLTR
eukprot:6697280-Alexandrium_andersonii.AAC.1